MQTRVTFADEEYRVPAAVHASRKAILRAQQLELAVDQALELTRLKRENAA